MSSRLFVAAFDSHWPKTDIPTLHAMFDFISRNKVAGFVFGGDQFDNEEISHHNKGKISIEASGDMQEITDSFNSIYLDPLDKLLPKRAERVWIQGNHDYWEEDFAQVHPQVRKLVIRKPAGWRWIPCGEQYRVGKMSFIHGETLSGRYHAQAAVDRYCTNVAYGHFHTIQSAVKIRPYTAERWVAQSFPAMCGLNPTYLRNKPTAWVNGFGIFEFYDGGFFNMWPVVVTRGRFTFGGRVYKS